MTVTTAERTELRRRLAAAEPTTRLNAALAARPPARSRCLVCREDLVCYPRGNWVGAVTDTTACPGKGHAHVSAAR